MTTEFAAVVMFTVGVAVAREWTARAVATSGMVLVAGHRAPRRPVFAAFAASLALGAGILAFWP